MWLIWHSRFPLHRMIYGHIVMHISKYKLNKRLYRWCKWCIFSNFSSIFVSTFILATCMWTCVQTLLAIHFSIHKYSYFQHKPYTYMHYIITFANLPHEKYDFTTYLFWKGVKWIKSQFNNLKKINFSFKIFANDLLFV